MRLIDADKLNLWAVLRQYCSSDACCEVTDIIDNTTTVNPYEWISVKDRLPDKFKYVLCFCPDKDYGSKVVVDYAESSEGYFANQFKYGAPTHWIPLPAPPIEEESNNA